MAIAMLPLVVHCDTGLAVITMTPTFMDWLFITGFYFNSVGYSRDHLKMNISKKPFQFSRIEVDLKLMSVR